MIPPGCCTTDQSGLTLLFLPFLHSQGSTAQLCHPPEPSAPALASHEQLQGARNRLSSCDQSCPASRWDLLAVLAQPCPVPTNNPEI